MSPQVRRRLAPARAGVREALGISRAQGVAVARCWRVLLRQERRRRNREAAERLPLWAGRGATE